MRNTYVTSREIRVLSILTLAILFTMTLGVRASAAQVRWIGEDMETKGDWIHKKDIPGLPFCEYGKYAFILPNSPRTQRQIPVGNFSVPIGGYSELPDPPYNWDAGQVDGIDKWKGEPIYYDEFSSQIPGFCYYLNGTRIYPGEPPFIQYPVFEYAWDDWHTSQTDPREAYYTKAIPDTGNGPGWRLCAWDDGGERCQPEHGYINVTLCFPQGSYYLSLYAYDYERTSRYSEEYRIYDSTGTQLLASRQISGTAFDEGVYEIFSVTVPAGGAKIIVQVYNDAGHLPQITPESTWNVVLSGIFVDKAMNAVGGELVSSNGLGALSSLVAIVSAIAAPASLVAYTIYRKRK